MYRIVDIDGKVQRSWDWVGSFKTEVELLDFLHDCFRDEEWREFRKGVDDLVVSNHILYRCCHTWGERHIEFDGWSMAPTWIYCDLQILDPWDRIMDIKLLAEKAYIHQRTPQVYKRYQGNWDVSMKWILIKKRFKHYEYSWKRKVQTGQERRISCDEMHRPYTRGGRRGTDLDPWRLDNRVSASGSWKQLKIKRQWMEHL